MRINITPIISKGIRYMKVGQVFAIIPPPQSDPDVIRKIVDGSIISNGLFSTNPEIILEKLSDYRICSRFAISDVAGVIIPQ